MLNYIIEHLDTWGPLLVPFGFIFADTLFRWERDCRHWELLGIDAAQSAAALFTGTFFAELYFRRLSDQRQIIGSFIIVGFLGLAWWLSLCFSIRSFPIGKGNAFQPWLGASVGTVALYWSSLCSWDLIK